MDELTALGQLADDALDIGDASLLFAALGHPGITLGRYRNHFRKLSGETAARYKELLEAGAADTPETKLAALKHTLADKHGYEGDHEDPDHIQNADMIQVIDRRKGSPVSLSLLYIHVARQLGWESYGLNIPGYFAVRLDHAGHRVIFDPFQGCSLLQAADLRRLVKKALGPHAELSVDYYEPAGNREMLVRLQNHTKFRQIETEDYPAALRSVEAMRALDPAEYRLLLDAGVLYARTNQPQAAMVALESYLGKAPPGRDRQEAVYLLEEIKHSIDA